MLDIILEDLQQARAYASDVLSHVDESMWHKQPAAGVNPVAWQVGHLAVAEYGLCLKRIRGVKEEDEKLLPPDFLTAFGKGSTPATDPSAYPAIDLLMSVFHNVHQQVLKETRQLTEDALSEEAGPPHPMFSTKGGALRFSPKHEMLHVGQIAMIRRMLGGEPLR